MLVDHARRAIVECVCGVVMDFTHTAVQFYPLARGAIMHCACGAVVDHACEAVVDALVGQGGYAIALLGQSVYMSTVKAVNMPVGQLLICQRGSNKCGQKPLNPFLSTVLAGLQRQLAKPPKKKEPVTVKMVSAMMHSSTCSLTDLRLLSMALLGVMSWLSFAVVTYARACP